MESVKSESGREHHAKSLFLALFLAYSEALVDEGYPSGLCLPDGVKDFLFCRSVVELDDADPNCVRVACFLSLSIRYVLSYRDLNFDLASNDFEFFRRTARRAGFRYRRAFNRRRRSRSNETEQFSNTAESLSDAR